LVEGEAMVKDWSLLYDLSQGSEEHPGGVPRPASETLPTMYDLPSEHVGDAGLPDEFHRIQSDFLMETCRLEPGTEYLAASDLNLYYDVRHPLWYKRPDWFLVVGVPRFVAQQELRLSYVMWQEGVRPFVVVELLSPSTADEDLGRRLREVSKPPTKWQVYEQIVGVPFYVVYDRYDNQLRVFRLVGEGYEAVEAVGGRMWFEGLQRGIGLWEGTYQETVGLWLRWYDAEGWVPTPDERAVVADERAEAERLRAEAADERAEAERLRAEAEAERAEAERERAERLAALLRERGIEVEEL
jgi:Uma2 family endonuclease